MGVEIIDIFNIWVNVVLNLIINNLIVIERIEVEIINENLLVEDFDIDIDVVILIYELIEVLNVGILKLDNDILELVNIFI